jgi:hypothetical protein
MGGESSLAGEAFPPSADDVAILAQTGIDNFIFNT